MIKTVTNANCGVKPRSGNDQNESIAEIMMQDYCALAPAESTANQPRKSLFAASNAAGTGYDQSMAVNALAVDAERELVDLVRCGLRDRLIEGGSKTPTPPTHPVLLEPAGCFVTLHRHGKLRGCIGRLDATQPLWTAAIEMAHAVLEDPRFADEPVTLQELPELEFDISILSPLEPAPSHEAVDPLTEGIYLTCGGRTGCFLPQVARETGWSREQLLSRLCTEKMGLSPDAWRDPGAKLSKFSVTVIGPVPAT